MVAFDTETTGIDVETDRIVTAYLGDSRKHALKWLIDPGVPIPTEATAIHGITSTVAQKGGRPAAMAISEIVAALAQVLRSGAVVAFNARFDFTLLDRECRRHSGIPLEEAMERPVRPVVDPLILDWHLDRYRPGRRTLDASCQAYGVSFRSAHEAQGDALAALELARSIGRRYPQLGKLKFDELHKLQVRAAGDRAADLAAYRRRQGQPVGDVNGEWPVKLLRGAAGADRSH